MAEHRQKSHHILLSTEGKNTVLDLYDAALWPEKSSDEGQVRARIDGKWYSPAGKYSFLSYPAVADLVARLLTGLEELTEEPAPDFRVKDTVRVCLGECLGSVPLFCERGFVVAPPIRAYDGNWYLAVRTFDGISFYPCRDIKLLSR